MMPNTATPANALQLARYGHIATALRDFMDHQRIERRDLAPALGLKRGDSRAYLWLSGKGAPGPDARKQIHKATGIALADLSPRETPPLTVADAPQLLLPGQVGTVLPRMIKTTGDILAVNMAVDGQTRVRLDVTLPVARAMSLIRLLFDSGIASPPEEAAHDEDAGT